MGKGEEGKGRKVEKGGGGGGGKEEGEEEEQEEEEEEMSRSEEQAPVSVSTSIQPHELGSGRKLKLKV